MIKKTDDLLHIEQCFTQIKAKQDINGNLKRIERALNRLFDLKFELSVVENDTNSFFGMNIYPSVSTMDVLVESIINKESSTSEIIKIWQTNDTWFIEIDSLLLYDTKLGTNPAEITAVLLHEIGHIVYDSSIPRRLTKVLRYKIMKLNYQMRKLVSEEKIRKLFNLAILESCSTKSFTFVNANVERLADKFVIQYGYGEDLDNLIGKLIQTQGNSMINRTESEINGEITSIVNWTVINIKELEFRKKSLRNALKVELLKTPSEFIKRVIQDIHRSFFGDSNDRYRQLLSEQYSSVAKDVYSELQADQYLDQFVNRVLKEASFGLFDKFGKLKKLNQSDIDVLEVEAENIQNTDDKIYLLDRLYEYLDLVNTALDYIQLGKPEKVAQSKSTLLRQKEQLEKLREQIMETKIIDKEYGVFIRYPKGYQG